jgi:endonuclease III
VLEAALLETLNRGDMEALLALHGIGKKRAELILEVIYCHANVLGVVRMCLHLVGAVE